MKLATGALFAILSTASAAELKPETLKAWNEYVQTVDASMEDRVRAGKFLRLDDESLDRRNEVRGGEIFVASAVDHNPRKVRSGLIHHWVGVTFLPNAKIDNVLAVVRDYSRYKDYYNPVIIDSRMLHTAPAEDSFTTVVTNKFLKAALESEYRSSFIQASPKRWYSIANTVHVQEVESYGQPNERRLPEDEGSGYIWRLHTITRYEERDGGVYIETEALALSRDIPASLRWMVDPIVRRTSKGSLVTTLRQTQDAILSSGQVATTTPKPAQTSTVRSFR